MFFKTKTFILFLFIHSTEFGKASLNKDINQRTECTNEGEKVPFAGECIWYNQCINGIYKPYRCPRKTQVDPNDSIEHWTSQMFHPDLKKCVDKARLPVAGKCNMYSECRLGPSSPYEKWTQTVCEPASFRFDPISQKCIDSAEPCVTATTTTEIPRTTTISLTTTTKNPGFHLNATLKGHTGFVTSLAYYPKLAILASASQDHKIKLWNPYTTDLLRTIRAHEGVIHCLAFSKAGQLASGSDDMKIKLWEPTSGQLVKTIVEDTSVIYSLAFKNRFILASGHSFGDIKLWNTVTGDLINTINAHKSIVDSLVFIDKSLLASGSRDTQLLVWNVESGDFVQRLMGHQGWVRGLAVSPTGELASCSSDHKIIIYDPNTGVEKQRMQGGSYPLQDVAYNDEGWLASCGNDNLIKIWDSDGIWLKSLWGHQANVRKVLFVDNKLLASASNDNTVKLWKLLDQ